MENIKTIKDWNKLEEEIFEIQAQIESGGWSWGKPTKKTDPLLESIVSKLRIQNKEKWVDIDYPRSHEEDEASGYLSFYVANSAKINTVNYVKLKKSCITGDYIAKIQFNKPKSFDLEDFKKKFWQSINKIIFMYNSLGEIQKIEEKDNKVIVKVYCKVAECLRFSNLLSSLKNINKKTLNILLY